MDRNDGNSKRTGITELKRIDDSEDLVELTTGRSLSCIINRNVSR